MPDILDEGGGDLLDEAGGVLYDEAGAPPATASGSWWGLHSIYEQQRQEFEAFISRPPVACPWCGEPLTYAPATTSGSGVERYCRFDSFRYPSDYIAPSRPWPGTI